MIRQDLKINLLPAIENYRTVRRFSKQPIEEKEIMKILEAGRIAPSAKNRQPWRFVVITEDSLKKKLEEAAYGQEHIGSASVIVALGTTNIDYKMPNGQLSYPIDLSFAASFMILQAGSDDIGSCIVTTYNEPEVREILTVPYSMRIVMLIAFGYPETDEANSIRNRKELSSIVSRNHW